jgi:hypothetical protein
MHSHNYVPNPSADENKTTRNSVPWNQNRTRNSIPNHKTRQSNILKIVSEKTTFDVQTIHFVKLFCCWFVKLIFSAEFLSVPFRASEFGMPRNECFLPRNSGNRSESIPRNFFTTASNIIWPKFRPADSRHRHVYVWGGGGAYRMTRNKTMIKTIKISKNGFHSEIGNLKTISKSINNLYPLKTSCMTPRVGPANMTGPIKYGLYTDLYEHCKCINVLHTHNTSIGYITVQ